MHLQEYKSGQTGFTLLELMVAFTILALMAGLIFASLRLAVNSYEKSQERIVEEAEQRVLFDQVKRQIGSLFPLRPTTATLQGSMQYGSSGDAINPVTMGNIPLFYGTDQFVTFITVAPLVLQENPGLTVVRYGLANDEYGDYYFGAMEARYTGLESFLAMIENPSGKPLPLVENIKTLEIDYYGYDPQSQTYNWYTNWSGEDTGAVPSAIRVVFDNDSLVVPINAQSFGTRVEPGIQALVGSGGR